LAGESKLAILSVVSALLEQDFPDPTGTQHDTADGTVFEFGDETEAYTELIPALLGTLQRVSCSPNVPPSVTGRILARVLDVWRPVVRYEVIWAPGNAILMSSCIADIASLPGISSSERIAALDALMINADDLPTIVDIARLCSVPIETDPVFGERCGEVAERILELLVHDDYADPDDRSRLLLAVGRVGTAPALGGGEARGNRIRRRIAEALEEGVRRRIEGASRGIQAMLDCATLSDTLRRELAGLLEETA
jgi:hypothetical protein